MQELLTHLLGDFVLQTDWMGMNKSKRSLPCLIHVLVYTACFLLLTHSWKALAVIGGSHFLLDRFHWFVRRLIHFRNSFFRPSYPPYEFCDTTGCYDDSPINSWIPDKEQLKAWGRPRLFFVTLWLYIIVDNTIHLTINHFALKYL